MPELISTWCHSPVFDCSPRRGVTGKARVSHYTNERPDTLFPSQLLGLYIEVRQYPREDGTRGSISVWGHVERPDRKTFPAITGQFATWEEAMSAAEAYILQAEAFMAESWDHKGAAWLNPEVPE